ncbi:hypothetical protein TSUD_340460 [Trifolium subterraneum]|uniref:Uncharacterized protein n=1 Tax=Trifolium subterraneum TaxID=3900 RepID=A0A2Z6LJD0_TRISU|nr:hypothetical protein TSUD_340460 [Trifolium subterraneum]
MSWPVLGQCQPEMVKQVPDQPLSPKQISLTIEERHKIKSAFERLNMKEIGGALEVKDLEA